MYFGVEDYDRYKKVKIGLNRVSFLLRYVYIEQWDINNVNNFSNKNSKKKITIKTTFRYDSKCRLIGWSLSKGSLIDFLFVK